MKKTFLLIALVLVGILTATAANQRVQAPLTRTTVAQGKVQGFVQDGIGTFLGIPYALPPVGDLRWKAPVPAKAWK